MAICKGCSDVFHLDCIPDALDCDTNGNWYCTKCTKDNLQLGPEGAPKMEPIKNETNLREISNRNEVISEISIKKEICDTPAIGASVSEHQQLIEETTTKESETSELEAEADDDADALMTAEDDPKSENLVSGNSDSESCEIIKLDSNVLTRASEIDMNENTNESSKDSTTIKIEPLEIKEEKIDDDEEVKEMVEPDQASDSNETNPPILDEDTSRSSSGSVNAGLAEGASNGQPTGTDYVDLVDEYRRLLPSYIRQYEINIDKEAIEKLKLLK